MPIKLIILRSEYAAKIMLQKFNQFDEFKGLLLGQFSLFGLIIQQLVQLFWVWITMVSWIGLWDSGTGFMA